MPIVFQGHLIFPWGMSWDLTATFLPLVVFLILRHFQLLPKIGRKMNLWDSISVFLFFIPWAPNAAYEMFEVKHLLLIDHVADHPDIWSYIVFIGVSLLGFLVALYFCRLVIDHYAASNKERKTYAFILSLDYGVGVLLGLLSLNSYDVFNISKWLAVLTNVPLHFELIVLALATTIFFFTLNLVLDHRHQPRQ